MKVLVADKISAKGVAYLRKQPGLDVVEAYGSSPAELLELVRDVHAIAVRSESKITADVIAAAPLLKVVGRAGVGIDNVDVDAATERGVIVMNTPSGNTIAPAEEGHGIQPGGYGEPLQTQYSKAGFRCVRPIEP